MVNLQDKQAVIAKINEVAKSALSAVLADYRGVTVNKMNELRKASRKNGIYMSVVRNTLISRAIEGTVFECLKKLFVGPTLIAFSNEHPGAAARLFKAFSKDNMQLKIKVAAFNGKVIQASQIDYLATMPTYKESIASFMLIIKEVCAGKLIRTITALCDKKNMA